MKICAEQKELMDTETECFIRDRDNIDDFLYEIDSGFLKKVEEMKESIQKIQEKIEKDTHMCTLKVLRDI